MQIHFTNRPKSRPELDTYRCCSSRDTRVGQFKHDCKILLDHVSLLLVDNLLGRCSATLTDFQWRCDAPPTDSLKADYAMYVNDDRLSPASTTVQHESRRTEQVLSAWRDVGSGGSSMWLVLYCAASDKRLGNPPYGESGMSSFESSRNNSRLCIEAWKRYPCPRR